MMRMSADFVIVLFDMVFNITSTVLEGSLKSYLYVYKIIYVNGNYRPSLGFRPILINLYVKRYVQCYDFILPSSLATGD